MVTALIGLLQSSLVSYIYKLRSDFMEEARGADLRPPLPVAA